MKAWRCFGNFLYLSAFCSLLVCNVLQATMYAYPIETANGEYDTSQRRGISKDNDNDNGVQFVKVKLKKIINPATKQELEVDTDA
jgi:hypothetical protein